MHKVDDDIKISALEGLVPLEVEPRLAMTEQGPSLHVRAGALGDRHLNRCQAQPGRRL